MNVKNDFRELNNAEIRPFYEKSNYQGALLVAANWALISLAFAISAIWPYWPTYLLSIILLANRQLGIAILMHDAAHHLLFKNKRLNNLIGQILCGAPVIAGLHDYRTYHLKHHKDAGTQNDPDYPNYKNYPVTHTSFLRKIARDLSGITGIKNLWALLLMNAGTLSYDFVYKNKEPKQALSFAKVLINLVKGLWLPILCNLMLWSILFSLGYAYLYVLWVAAYFTFYQLFLRIRNAAEHGAVPDLLNTEPRKHARTTAASWWERLTVAPNYVNFHLEHHLRPSVPCYRLKAFHQYLVTKGYYNDTHIAQGYADVLRQLTHAA
ncbi:MAG: fatty acid desaturase [Glaciecola sp.]|jgi:fatty acid desaturase